MYELYAKYIYLVYHARYKAIPMVPGTVATVGPQEVKFTSVLLPPWKQNLHPSKKQVTCMEAFSNFYTSMEAPTKFMEAFTTLLKLPTTSTEEVDNKSGRHCQWKSMDEIYGT